MRKCFIFFSVLILFLPLGAPISWAQEMIIQKGVAKMQVHLPEGKLTLYLPSDIRHGDHISGTILAEPAGAKTAQLSKNTKALENYQVMLADMAGQTTANPRIISAKIPDGKNSVSVKVLNQMGETVAQNYLPVLPTGVNPPAPMDCQIPNMLLSENIVSIPGKFDGQMSNTTCSYNGLPLTILAESGKQIVIKTPGNASPLKGNLELKEGGLPAQTPCNQPIQLVKMDVSTGPLNFQKGTQTWLDVSIRGLNSLQTGDTAGLHVINQSTGVVTMQPHNQFYMAIPGPSDSLFHNRFNLVGIQKGDFKVDVNLDLPGSSHSEPPSGLPPFDLSDLKTAAGYPGSYGLITGEPCSPEGATIRWQWHRTFQCLIKDKKVLPCGHSKEGNDLYEDIKELLEDLEMDKPYETAEKMAKAFSTAKAFSYAIHVVRPWVDYDIEYVCRGGVWQPVGGLYMRHGTDDLGWHEVKPPKTFCWLTFSDTADVNEFNDALEAALRAACK